MLWIKGLVESVGWRCRLVGLWTGWRVFGDLGFGWRGGGWAHIIVKR